MQIFQIFAGVAHYKTKYTSLSEILPGTFPPDVLFVEAPDNVREGWGYINGEFVRPTPPEGWLYDDATGTFYLENELPPSQLPTIEKLLAEQDQRILDLTVDNLLLKEGLL
jgi:hypothetical protein